MVEVAVLPVKKRFKQRTKPALTAGQVAFCQQFARAWIDYVHSQGLKCAPIYRQIAKDKRVSWWHQKLEMMAAGYCTDYNYLYFFQVISEAVGKDMMDFIVIRVPE